MILTYKQNYDLSQQRYNIFVILIYFIHYYANINYLTCCIADKRLVQRMKRSNLLDIITLLD